MRTIYRLVLAMLVLLLSTAGVPPANVQAADNPSAALTQENLQAFIEPYVEEKMREWHIPGMVVLIVKDDEILYNQGFGYAHLDHAFEENLSGTRVDPGQSLFRIGSISKLFTATAIMQLVERGDISLEADVNDYLSEFQIDTQGYGPVKIKHLLTHTPGFDEDVLNTEAGHYHDRLPLREYLRDNRPDMVYEPGTYIQYSNYGLGLLGLVIEERTGLSYEQYVQMNLLDPLGMDDTHVGLSDSILPNLAREYAYASNTYVELPLYEYNFPPAGSIVSTAEDMANFLRLHLNNGTWNGAELFSEQTAQLMHSRQFSQHPQVQGFGFGFFERNQQNRQFFEHGGNTSGTHSMFFIDKEAGLGVFTSNNGQNGAAVPFWFIHDFVNTFYADHSASVEPNQETDLSRYVGSYQSNRYSRDDFTKLILAMSSPVAVSIGDRHALHVQMPLGSGNYVPTDDELVFVNPETMQRIAFEQDERGRITRLFGDDSYVYERVGFLQSPLLHLGLIAALAVTCLATLLTAGVRKLARRLRRTPATQSRQAWYRDAGTLNILVQLSVLVFFLTFAIAILRLESISELFHEVPLLIQAVMFIPLLIGLLAAVQIVFLAIDWARSTGSWPSRLVHTFSSLLTVGVLAVLYYYNLVAI